MIDIKNKSKVHIHWKVSPYDYSKERENSIVAKASKKYGIPKDKVKVIPDFIMQDDAGKDIPMNSDIIDNIQDPSFQVKLFSDYITLNNIINYDFELIKKIDSEINAKIDYQVYDKYKRFSIKWVRWDNFLSYGANNYFDFSNIGKLVSLSSQPANQGGKTTFCIDLFRFLLFGTTTKYKTQDKFFNKHLPAATNVIVEGCITIDGTDYVIKRTLSRPSLDRRTQKSKTTQKVEYYKIIGTDKEELVDYIDNQQEENSIQTNKAIKEAIGRESDFDLIMSVTDKTLDDLVEKKEAERGRLLARWIGLLPIEQKDIIAREKFNSEVKPFLLSNQYNIETLEQEIKAYEVVITNLENENKRLEKENETLSKEITEFENGKNVLLSSKRTVDENLMKIDIQTLEQNIENSISYGKKKAYELEQVSNELKEMGEVKFSVEEYDSLQDELVKHNKEIAVIGENYKRMIKDIEHLQKSEFCPTCGKRLDSFDPKKIEELKKDADKVKDDGTKCRAKINEVTEKISKMKDDREKYDKSNKLGMQKAALELTVEKLRNEYKELIATKKEYKLNSEAIDNNNKIDIQLRNYDIILNEKRRIKEENLSTMSRNTNEVSNDKKQIEDRNKSINRLKEEEILVRNWKIYLELVGKDGISKMVLRKALPIINGRLAQLLNDVCDFDVEVSIDAKNDVMFSLIKDGVRSELAGASGFELTASALALRAVLAEISSISKANFLNLDEVWGRVAKENYDNMKSLIEKIAKNYDTIILISHLDEVKDWCDTHIVVKKENNVSTLSLGKSV